MSLSENLHNLIERVERSRLRVNPHHIVKVVAVSKYSTKEDIEKLYNCGQRAFGESKLQDFKFKYKELKKFPIEWHFIGRVQKNKINHLIELEPYLIHSIDSFELAMEFQKRLEQRGKKLNILLQINSAKESQKAGVMPEIAVDEYFKIEQSCPNLNLKGVMSIGAHSENRDLIQESFKITRDIFERVNGEYCSMGMSLDFELAIDSGSNLIRVGSSLFKS